MLNNVFKRIQRCGSVYSRKPRIFARTYIGPLGKTISSYSIFNFDGIPISISDRRIIEEEDFIEISGYRGYQGNDLKVRLLTSYPLTFAYLIATTLIGCYLQGWFSF